MSPLSSEVDPDGSDDVAAHVAALAALPGMGPASLVAVLAGHPSPLEAWSHVRAGRIRRPAPRQGLTSGPPAGSSSARLELTTADRGGGGTERRPSWADIAERLDPVSWWGPHARAGIGVTWPGRPDFPDRLREDPRPPGAVFFQGRLDVLDRTCVAVVGTRNATANGRAVAFEMGRDLASAGICVVSGLALGIDGAAHAGAVAAVAEGAPGATVGVAASGPDVPYPRRHARLWREVTEAGAILSENLPGRPAQAWRFPTRNRIIAALASLVVVVESHRCGGSLITAEAALERGVEVRVVPGPVHSPASEGSNQLLYDGPGPVRDASDVLDTLGIFCPVPAPGGRLAAPASGSAGEATVGRILEALGWQPSSPGQIMARTGLDGATVIRGLEALTASGRATEEAGWWSRCRGMA